jgi:hypothetical protein
MNLIVDLTLLALGVVGSCEIVLRSSISHQISRLNRSVRKAVLRLSSAMVSDHWKALAARRYAADVLESTLFIFGVLVAALAPIIVSLWLVSGSLGGAVALALRPDVAIWLTVVAVGYLLLRARMRTRG